MIYELAFLLGAMGVSFALGMYVMMKEARYHEKMEKIAHKRYRDMEAFYKEKNEKLIDAFVRQCDINDALYKADEAIAPPKKRGRPRKV